VGGKYGTVESHESRNGAINSNFILSTVNPLTLPLSRQVAVSLVPPSNRANREFAQEDLGGS